MKQMLFFWLFSFCFLNIGYQQQILTVNPSMHQKRCEQIPAHFIPKHNPKHLRKNLLTTKFKWLSKYNPHSQNQRELSCFSQLARVSPCYAKDKRKGLLANKENMKTEPGIQDRYGQLSKENNTLTRMFLSKIFRSPQTRPIQEQRYSFGEEHDNLRNRSLLMRRVYNRKTLSSFQRGDTRLFSEKPKPKGNMQVNYTCDFTKKKENQSFGLSPWVLADSRTQNCDLIYYQ